MPNRCLKYTEKYPCTTAGGPPKWLVLYVSPLANKVSRLPQKTWISTRVIRCLASTVQSETVCRLLTSLPEAEMVDVVETWEEKKKKTRTLSTGHRSDANGEKKVRAKS